MLFCISISKDWWYFHTHSTYATGWAQSLRDIPIYGTTHADHTVCDIPCAAPMSDEMIPVITNMKQVFKYQIRLKKKTFL